ncbi:MAG: type II toxin-antitoxin system RelE/ParE family toxin [Alphaproteobacteria bacterium]
MFTIKYRDQVTETDIPALPKTMRLRIQKAIEERLVHDPIAFGKPLRFNMQGNRRMRVGDYRVVYRIEVETNTVIINGIRHRKDIYD